MTGRLFANRRLVGLSALTTAVVWLLLFLLGVEAGANPEIVRGFATIGVTAAVICGCSLAGSIAAAWCLWRLVRRPEAAREPVSEDKDRGALRRALCGSGVVVAFFAAGCAAGWLWPGVVPAEASGWALGLLMCCVGVSLGHDTTLVGRLRQTDPRLALLPVATAVGTLVGAALASLAVARFSAADTMAVGAGFGYYSLSSVFIADLRGAELAAIALVCNLLRELFTLVCAPVVARWFGPLAAVSIGGATSMDTTLPSIVRAAGGQYAFLSLFHGCALDFSVPFLVTLFCSL